MKKRSVGVTIFAVLFIIGGVSGLLINLLIPVAHRMVKSAIELEQSSEQREELKKIDALLGSSSKDRVLVGATSTIQLAAGIGLLGLMGWAYSLTFLMIGFSIFWAIFSFIFLKTIAGGFMLASLGWHTFMIWYFLRPGVKAQFVKTASSNQQ